MARSLAATSRQAAVTLLVTVILGACGGGSPASSAGATGGPGSTAAAGGPASSPGSAGSGSPAAGGGTTDYCTVFTAAEITTFLGRTAHASGPQAATTADNCTWQDDNLTTVWVLKSDADTCASDKEAIGSAGSSYPGADFAGPSPLGAMFAGIVASGACYEVEVNPTERSPKADALAQLLQQFVERVGA